MWEAIKKLPGTVVILIATLLGIVVLSIMFPERAQILAILGICALVSVGAFRAKPVAGFIVTSLMIVAFVFWGPSIVQEFNRANDPNGTFASFFAKAKEQTINANRDYASGAISQASALAGVMAVDAKLSANLEVNIMRTGSTIDSAQLTLRPEQVDSLVLAASTIKENQLVLQNILAVAGITNVEPTKAADSLDTLVVDVANEDGATYKIPRGKTAEVSIDSAWYTCKFTRIEKYEKSWCDGDGYTIAPKKSVSGAAFSQRFLNPNESMGAVLVFDQNNPKGYRLAMGQTIVVPGGTVTIAVNDWRGGVFGGIGLEGMALSSKQIQRGGFYDNQGYLRVRIVLNSKY